MEIRIENKIFSRPRQKESSQIEPFTNEEAIDAHSRLLETERSTIAGRKLLKFEGQVVYIDKPEKDNLPEAKGWGFLFKPAGPQGGPGFWQVSMENGETFGADAETMLSYIQFAR